MRRDEGSEREDDKNNVLSDVGWELRPEGVNVITFRSSPV